MVNIDEILEAIQILTLQGSYVEASTIYTEAIIEAKGKDCDHLGELYYHYASFLFDISEYEMSLKTFESAYNLNFMQEQIKEILFSCFVVPNLEEFMNSYDTQLSKLGNNNIIENQLPSFEELPLSFFPYDEDKYFIFNSNINRFEGVLDISDATIMGQEPVHFEDELSDIVISNLDDFSSSLNLILSSKCRNIYFIALDYLKFMSFIKVPNIVNKFFNNVIIFDTFTGFQTYFHTNKSIYLPRLFSAQNDIDSKMLKSIIEEEHAFRLTPEGRDNSRVILTIAIPTYNRGHLALEHILELTNLPFDAEVEFVLSNNCSTIYWDEYNKIKNLTDSRINYYESPINIGGNMNFCKVIGLASGKYVCLLSDEDSIYLPAVSHYISIMKNNPNISFIRASDFTAPQNSAPTLYPKGRAAFLNSFLTTNYITGLIYRRDLYQPLNLYSWTEKYISESNKAFCNYSQTCWTAAYALHGDYYIDNMPLYSIGTQLDDDVQIPIGSKVPQLKEETAKSDTNQPLTLVYYSTLESRLEQHNGFIDLLNQLADYMDFDTYIEAYRKLIEKTFFLVFCVKDNYDSAGEDWNEICMKICYCCVDGIPKLKVLPPSAVQNMLLELINANYVYYSSF